MTLLPLSVIYVYDVPVYIIYIHDILALFGEQ